LTPDPSLLAAARDRFVAATNLVYTGAWLKTDEGSYTKASYVRLSGDPEIQTVNARGRTEFSIGLRAADPIKYKWNTEDSIYGYENVLIPCRASSPAADGTEIIEHEGNYPVSVYLTITGPLVGPTIISNDTSEELITVTGTLRDATTKTINNRGLTDNLVTVSTSTTHGLVLGDVVTISGLGSPYDGDVVVLSVPTTSTFTYQATGSNVAYGAASGSLAYGPDTLEINTYDRSVFLNGEYLGARAKLEVYNDWINLYPGSNTISFYPYQQIEWGGVAGFDGPGSGSIEDSGSITLVPAQEMVLSFIYYNTTSSLYPEKKYSAFASDLKTPGLENKTIIPNLYLIGEGDYGIGGGGLTDPNAYIFTINGGGTDQDLSGIGSKLFWGWAPVYVEGAGRRFFPLYQ
jgi:hypothetical protein